MIVLRMPNVCRDNVRFIQHRLQMILVTCIYAHRKVIFFKLTFRLRKGCETYYEFPLVVTSPFWGPKRLNTRKLGPDIKLRLTQVVYLIFYYLCVCMTSIGSNIYLKDTMFFYVLKIFIIIVEFECSENIQIMFVCLDSKLIELMASKT